MPFSLYPLIYFKGYVIYTFIISYKFTLRAAIFKYYIAKFQILLYNQRSK